LLSWWPVVPLHKKRWVELCLAFVALLAVCAIVFRESNRLGLITSRPSFVGPVLLWLAFRFTKREVLAGVALLSVVAIYATTHHQGPFASSSMIESFLSLQLFCAMVAITMLVLSATVRQNREYQISLKTSNANLELKVQERTKELEKKTRILEALNAQLVIEARERRAAEERLLRGLKEPIAD
jgi:integral membrane sensor domain MASE1